MAYTEWRDEYTKLLDRQCLVINEDDHDFGAIGRYNPQPDFHNGYTPAEAVMEAIEAGYSATTYYTGDTPDYGEYEPDYS